MLLPYMKKKLRKCVSLPNVKRRIVSPLFFIITVFRMCYFVFFSYVVLFWRSFAFHINDTRFKEKLCRKEESNLAYLERQLLYMKIVRKESSYPKDIFTTTKETFEARTRDKYTLASPSYVRRWPRPSIYTFFCE